jgi:hypothetical protein
MEVFPKNLRLACQVHGHLVSIAQSPERKIFIGGEDLYKLESFEPNRNKLTYLNNVPGTKNIEVTGLTANLTTKVLAGFLISV